jgi:serine protease Do
VRTKVDNKSVINRSPQSLGRGLVSLFVVAVFFAVTMGDAVGRPAPTGFADLAERLLPAVVNISTRQVVEPRTQRNRGAPPEERFEEFFEEFLDEDENRNPPRQSVSLGSGFVIDPEGYIVTNDHVIGEADEITVTFTDGEQFEAQIVGRDAVEDIALLKIEVGHELPVVKFGNSDLMRAGDWVMTIGNPFGLGGSVTAGIVSARHRNINAGVYDDFLQTDASINRGNSGGPMFNLLGEVVGVNTMIFSPGGVGNIGIGFAIPSTRVKRIAAQLRAEGRVARGWMGVGIQSLTRDISGSIGFDGTKGAIVTSVQPDGPSFKAGVQPGDIVLEFGGLRITDSNQLIRLVGDTPVGIDVPFKVWRNGDVVELSLTTSERIFEAPEPINAPEEAKPPETEPSGIVEGLILRPLDAAARERYEVPEEVVGVVIRKMAAQSEAAQRGLRPGDVIAEVNLMPIHSADDFSKEVAKAKEAGRATILLRIYRSGFLIVPLPLS